MKHSYLLRSLVVTTIMVLTCVNYSVSQTLDILEKDGKYHVTVNSEKGESIKVFPNPANKCINIQSEIANAEIHVFDIFGNSILIHQFQGYSSINIEKLSSGIYLYQILSKHIIIKQGKLVKY